MFHLDQLAAQRDFFSSLQTNPSPQAIATFFFNSPDVPPAGC